MLKPNYNEAKKRDNKDINIIYDSYIVPEEIKGVGEGKTYFVKTYGCQMNEHDSETISAMLEQLKYTKIDNYEIADIIILNTCAIRENVHDKVFGMIGRIKHLKETRPNVIAGLCGCMAQEEVVIDKILTKYNHLDFVFGTHNINNLPNILNDVINKKEQTFEVYSSSNDIVEGLPVKQDSPYKAWVNIMYGCDNFCTYCIVPYTRGKQKSRLSKDIINEVNDLISKGYKEITLLGQNVNSYGKDFIDTTYNFSNLLQEVVNTGVPRIRFVTSHPWDFSDDMIEVIKHNETIMPYIHIPVQSGSDKILKLMGRKYTKDQYLTLVDKLKTAIPNVMVSTDIIVGFPNETEADFNETLDVVEQCKFDFAYTFIYSKREGTPAALIEDNVSKDEKNERLYKLNKIINNYAKKSNENQVGKVLSVLVEGISQKDNTKVVGYSDNFKLVNIDAPIETIGTIIDVKITSAKSWSLNGEIM